MLESIEDVLKAESDADKVIGEARESATKERAAFAETETARIREAQSQADGSVRERLAAARDEQERRVADAREKLDKDEASFANDAAEHIEDAVRSAVEILVGEERAR
jgi:vacuolar-type H+-ATPase subunit H